jgi:hypothetical protein
MDRGRNAQETRKFYVLPANSPSELDGDVSETSLPVRFRPLSVLWEEDEEVMGWDVFRT